MKKELRRQFFHYFFGCIVIILIGLIGTQNFLIINVLILLIGYILSVKIKQGIKLPVINELLDYAGRTEEQTRPGKGALTFFLGTLAATILFYRIYF